MKKNILMVLLCSMTLFGAQVSAEEFREAEVHSKQIRLSEDGTGIIKVLDCDKSGCKNILIKVTQATIGILDGVEMGLLQAKNLARTGVVGLVYSADKKEALTIGFTQ